MAQIVFSNANDPTTVSYYASFPGRDEKTIPNYFTITPDGKLAQVFIELNEKFNGKRPMSKICNGVRGATFNSEDCFVECDGKKVKYQPNSVVSYDPQDRDFVFETIDPNMLVDWTARFRTRITIGVKNNVKGKTIDQTVIATKETPVYVPFSYNGSLVPNVFYFGYWGKSFLSVYQKYYAFDITDCSYDVCVTPFIDNEICKKLNKKFCNMFIQVKRKNANGVDVVLFTKTYNRNSEVQVSVDATGNVFNFIDRTFAKGNFRNDEDYMNECKAQGILFMKNKF